MATAPCATRPAAGSPSIRDPADRPARPRGPAQAIHRTSTAKWLGPSSSGSTGWRVCGFLKMRIERAAINIEACDLHPDPASAPAPDLGTIWGPHTTHGPERPARIQTQYTAIRARIPRLTCRDTPPKCRGSRGRRFKSCQPDGEAAGQRLNPRDRIEPSDISGRRFRGPQMVPKLTPMA